MRSVKQLGPKQDILTATNHIAIDLFVNLRSEHLISHNLVGRVPFTHFGCQGENPFWFLRPSELFLSVTLRTNIFSTTILIKDFKKWED